MLRGLVGSEMCIREQQRARGGNQVRGASSRRSATMSSLGTEAVTRQLEVDLLDIVYRLLLLSLAHRCLLLSLPLFPFLFLLIRYQRNMLM